MTCTDAEHAALRAELATILAGRSASLTSPRGLAWLSRARPWAGEGLMVGECTRCYVDGEARANLLRVPAEVTLARALLKSVAPQTNRRSK